MFILVPSIVIFLSFSYLWLKEEPTVIEYTIIYSIIFLTVAGSFKLYINIKRNIKQLEQNKILAEIEQLKKQLSKETEDITKQHINKKLLKLKEEYEKLS